MSLTTDRNNPDLHKEDEKGQNKAYLVLSDEELAKGFVRPYRDTYIHEACGVETKMNKTISDTYRRDPKFYGSTYCCGCQMHLPVSHFKWTLDGEVVGS